MGSNRAAEMLGKGASTWTRFEKGELDWEPYRKEIAKILKVKPKDLDDPSIGKKAVPVTCWIKNQSYIYRNPKLKLTETVKPIDGLPRTTEACVVKNPDHPNYEPGTILYFDSNPTTSPSKFLERECIVKIEKSTRGDTMLAWVSRGTQPGSYMLHFHKKKIMENVKVISAHPILKSMKP